MFTSVWTRLMVFVLSVVPGRQLWRWSWLCPGLLALVAVRYACACRLLPFARLLARLLSYRPRYTHALRQVSLRYDVTHVLNGTQFSLLLLAY